MPSESAAGERGLLLPPQLEADRLAFRRALEQEAARRPAGDIVAAALRDPRALTSWDRLAALVFRQSATLALVAERDRVRIYTRHILDSLNPLDILGESVGSILDVGTGAGFPGVPLAIARPRTRVILLESRDKKVGFLERAIRELSLSNATAVSARLEDYGRSWHADPVDVVTIRAVGGSGGLLDHASRAARAGGRWIYFLGSRDRADSLLESLDADRFGPRVERGIFGGMLLVGTFGPDSDRSALDVPIS